MEAATRGRWEISRQSFHWRLYQYWRRLGGGGPESKGRPIDLCHYMRVVMIWVWFRAFWFGSFFGIPILLLFVLAVFVIGNMLLIQHYPHLMWLIYKWSLVGFAGGLALAAVLIAIIWWHDKQSESWKSFWRAVGKPFVFLGRNEVRGLRAIGKPLGRFLIWLGEKIAITSSSVWYGGIYPLLMRTIVWRIQVVSLLGLLSLAGMFWLIWSLDANIGRWILQIGLGVVIGIAILAVLLIAGEWLVRNKIKPWFQRRHDARMEELLQRPAKIKLVKPKKEKQVSQLGEFVRLLWMFLVARKQRICPFVEPKDGSTA